MTDKRVVITGSGNVSGYGLGTDALMHGLRNGHSCVQSTVGKFVDTRVKTAAFVPDYSEDSLFDQERCRKFLDPISQYALLAAREAVQNSALPGHDDAKEGVAVVVGTSIGGLDTIETEFIDTNKRPAPMTIPKLMASAPASQISMEFDFHGPSFVVSSACASAAHAIVSGLLLIKSNQAKFAIVGGAENTALKSYYRAWDSIRALTPDTCRPFSRGRNGLVLGEGASMFVLEDMDSARARGANILCEIIGFGMSADATDILKPNVRWIKKALKNCLENAKLNPSDVDYINAHGTGTILNDATETSAIKDVFREHAKFLKISSTKPLHGHALAASGSMELNAVLLAINEKIIPPTINFSEPDPACDLDYVTNRPEEKNVSIALSNSFAFGGLNVVLALKKV